MPPVTAANDAPKYTAVQVRDGEMRRIGLDSALYTFPWIENETSLCVESPSSARVAALDARERLFVVEKKLLFGAGAFSGRGASGVRRESGFRGASGFS